MIFMIKNTTGGDGFSDKEKMLWHDLDEKIWSIGSTRILIVKQSNGITIRYIQDPLH